MCTGSLLINIVKVKSDVMKEDIKSWLRRLFVNRREVSRVSYNNYLKDITPVSDG